jgi:DNA-directed RNA polymerase subunit K/omega
MEMNLGKNPFKKFTKSALIEMLEDAVMSEKERSLPIHKRGKKEKAEKDEATEEADEEREKLADLAEEQHGSPAPVEMDDEDLSDEAMDEIESKAKPAPKKKPKK